MHFLGRLFISAWLLCPLMGLLLLSASLIDHPTLLKLEYPIYDRLLEFRTTPSNDQVVLVTTDRHNASISGSSTEIDKNLTELIDKIHQLGGDTIALLDPPELTEQPSANNLSVIPSADPIASPQQLLFNWQNPLAPYRIDSQEGWNFSPRALNSDQILPESHLIFSPDPDGKIRSQTLLTPWNNQLLLSLPLQVAISAHGEKIQTLQTVPRELAGTLRTNRLQIPVSGYYRILLDIHPEQLPFQTHKAIDLLQGNVELETLKGKIILIGPANSYGDQHLVAGYGKMNTSELAALTTVTLLTDSTPQRPGWGWLLETAVCLFFIVLLVLITPRLSFRAGLAILLLFLISWGLVVATALIIFSLWLKFIPAAILCLGSFTLVRWHIGNQEKDQKKQENYKILAQRFQEQGLLDLALEKSLLINPIIKENQAMLYNLGLEFERKRMPHNAISIYQHLLQAGRFRDARKRLKQLENCEPTTVLGQNSNATVILNRSGEKPTLGRYRIERELGQGAMGTVYLGIDPKINRQVAIKTLAYQQVDTEELPRVKERFFREAEAAGNLSHPNIVTIYDVGEETDLAFFAMELLEGKDLSHYCRPKNHLPTVQVIDIISQVAAALDYAHRKGVIHRDIKPANIIFLEDGQTKVTDFGIARITTSSRTETGIILGTPSYMSPEQVAGKKVDGRSDLFSLGVVMYELLSGEKPFQGESMTALMYNISNSNYRPLAKICPKLPAACYTIVDKLLQKTFTRRFKSAAILQQELLALQKKWGKP